MFNIRVMSDSVVRLTQAGDPANWFPNVRQLTDEEAANGDTAATIMRMDWTVPLDGPVSVKRAQGVARIMEDPRLQDQLWNAAYEFIEGVRSKAPPGREIGLHCIEVVAVHQIATDHDALVFFIRVADGNDKVQLRIW